jgi:hypothetical protein
MLLQNGVGALNCIRSLANLVECVMFHNVTLVTQRFPLAFSFVNISFIVMKCCDIQIWGFLSI